MSLSLGLPLFSLSNVGIDRTWDTGRILDDTDARDPPAAWAGMDPSIAKLSHCNGTPAVRLVGQGE